MTSQAPLMSAQLGRRDFLRGIGVAGASLALASCARSSGGSGPTEIVFYQSKPEVIGYFDDLIDQFHQTQSRVRVRHDAASNLAGTFVRESPPDIGCLNYNFEVSRYVERGALSDLSDMPEAGRILDELQPLIDVTATYPDRTSVIPYSLMAAAVLYNRQIFAEHGLTVPTTWDELIAVCETLAAAGVTPLYSTFKDPWTIAQGSFDYSVGGTVDTTKFFNQLKRQGTNVGPDSPVSFEKQFLDAGAADAGARPVLAGQRGEPRLRGRERRVRERRGGHVPAGSVGDRGDREVQPRSRRRRVPAADDGRPGGPQGAGQHRPRAVDPGGLHEEGGGAGVPVVPHAARRHRRLQRPGAGLRRDQGRGPGDQRRRWWS